MSMPRASRGFSLLEVLVAFTILALVLTALFEVFSGGMRAARAGDSYTRAVAIAQSKLAELDADEALAEGEHRGEAEDPYSWRATVSPYSDAALPSDGLLMRPLAVSVEVSWSEGERIRSVELTTLTLVPSS